MDLRDDPNCNVESENSHSQNNKTDILLSPNNSHLPLADINNTNPRESVSSLEIAQKKWIENAKSWPVKDELQNAQLQWLRDFSNSKFLCTSTPQAKKKESRYTLPWTPPKSSAQDCPRRGVCVYKPGSNLPNFVLNGSQNEKGNSVKVARVEEPEKVLPLKRVELEKTKKPFPNADLKEDGKSPKKRYITVRKKLERLKKSTLEDEEKEIEDKPDPSPDKISEEKREATRQFMLRKRAEREREIEQQRRKEKTAEKEKKARMERLRETQQRVIQNAMKRQASEKKYVSRESNDLWEDSFTNLRQDSRKETLSPVKSSSINKSFSRPVSIDEINIVNEVEVKALDDPHIAELLLDLSIPTQKKMALLDRLEESAMTGKDSLSDIMASKEYLALTNTSPKPQTSDVHSIPPNFSPARPLNKSQTSIKFTDYDKASGISNFSTTENSFCSIPSTSKESINVLKYIKKDNPPQNIPSSVPNVPLNWRGTERSYNILRAVSNKHAAFEYYNKEHLKNNDKNNFEKIDPSEVARNLLRREVEHLRIQDNQSKAVCEKGVQCRVEDGIIPLNFVSPSENVVSTSKVSAVLSYPKSEGLRKPDIVLIPGRPSDPGSYGSSKAVPSRVPQSRPLVYGDEGFFDNLIETDIDPPTDPLEKREIVTYDTHLQVDQRVSSPNSKGRPQSLPNNINLPRDLNLSSKTTESNIIVNKKIEENLVEPDSFIGTNSLSIPQSLNLITPFHKATKNEEGHKKSLLVGETQQINRDSRIEEEIRKLESFNDSITTAIEKNKSFISDNEIPQKASLERTATSSTINNELLHETTLRGSHSSSSFDIQSEDFSGTSVAKFSLNMFIELLKDEDSRNVHQSSLLKMKEKSLTEKIKAEIAFLEVEKKKLKEAGNEDGVRNMRKKIRGLIIKLEHDLEELQRVRKSEKLEYRKRRQKLVEKINLLRIQLKMQYENQKVGSSKEGPRVHPSISVETKKAHVPDRRESDTHVAIFEKKRKELEHRETFIAERLAELENLSSWKQRYEEGEKRIQELEALLKKTPTQNVSKERENLDLVERGTSPCRIPSDDSQCEKQKEGSYSDTFDQASSSSAHERLDERDARKIMAIKVPLSPLIILKRRHSSGSDESILHSQTETLSDGSDMEVRVLALQQQLKQRKAKLESLHREYKKSQKERLIAAKEQSLLSQIQAYDLYIDQVKKELEKEKNASNVKIVKPLIKQPKIYSNRRKSDTWLIQDRKSVDDTTNESSQNALALTGSGDFISISFKDKQDNKIKKYSSSQVGSNDLEKLDLKSVLLKPSHSAPNLLTSSSDKTAQCKPAYSSTESCESDIDKVKLTKLVPAVKEGGERCKSASQISGGLREDKHYLIGSNTLSNESTGITSGKQGEEKLFEQISIATEVRDSEGSEEISSTQASIISKIIDINNVEQDNDIVSHKTDSDILPVEEIEDSITLSSKKSDTQFNISHKVKRSFNKDSVINNETKSDYIESNYDIPEQEISNEKETISELVSVSEINTERHSPSDVISEKISNLEVSERINTEKLSQSLVISENVDKSEIINEKTDHSEGISQEIEQSEIISEKIDHSENNEKIDQSEIISEKIDQSEISSEKEKIDQSEILSERIEQSVIVGENIDQSEIISVKVDQSEIISEKIDQSEIISEEIDTQSEISEKIDQSEIISEKIDQSEVISEKIDQSEIISEKIDQSETISEKIDQSEIISEKIDTQSDILSEIRKDQSKTISEKIKKHSNIVSKNLFSEDIIHSEESEHPSEESIIEEGEKSKSVSSGTLIDNIDVVSVKDSNLIISEDIVDCNKSTDKDASDLFNLSEAQGSKNISVTEIKESSLNESVKEVTYLEVSDHVFQKTEDNDTSEEDRRDSSELSENKLIESRSLAEELQEVFDDETLKENMIGSSMSEVLEEQEKSTFHSESDVVEIFSKDISEDLSDGGSFPLPLTNQVKKNSFDSDAEKNFSEQLDREVDTEITADKDSASEIYTNESVQQASHGSQRIVSTATEVPSDKIVTVPNEEMSIKSESSVKTLVSSEQIQKQSISETLETRQNVSLDDVENKMPIEVSSVKDSYPSNKSEITSGNLEEDKSFSESDILHESDVKSPLEELNLEDSLEENTHPLSSLKLQSKLYGGEEEYESASEASDSYAEDKLSEEDDYILTEQHSNQQPAWSHGADLKNTGAPMIDALQREGESALDVVWRDIAESAIAEGKELVINTYLKRIQLDLVSDALISLDESKQVGDNEEDEWDKEKLPRDQASEAEVLRLQQIRIDKEIEELEEEEARRYYYARPIPDKPPPPYTPRRSSLVSSVVEAAGELWSGRKEAPQAFMAGSPLKEFIWDLASELVLRADPPRPSPQPPWVETRRARPRKPIRTKEDLLLEVEKEAKIYLGIEEREVRENLITRWSRKRRDHVDEILVRESGEEEWEWTDFTEEESVVKNRIAEALIEESLAEATAALAQAFTCKFRHPTGTSDGAS